MTDLTQAGHDAPGKAGADDRILEVRDLVKHYPVRAGLFRRVVEEVHAVCGVSFDVARGETLGLVGESGCGKTTTGRVLMHLVPASSGSVRFDGTEVLTLRGAELRRLR